MLRKQNNDEIKLENERLKKYLHKVKKSDKLNLKYKTEAQLKIIEEEEQVKQQNKERVYIYFFIEKRESV